MKKTVIINLLKVAYFGESIGRDIRIEIKAFGRLFRVEQRIRPGAVKEFNEEIGRIDVDEAEFKSDILVRVREKDLIFSDTGEIGKNVTIDTALKDPQFFDFKVLVRERKKIFWKSTAVFIVTLKIQIGSEFPVQLKPYKSNNPRENYNLLDREIAEAVKIWNEEFSRQENPSPILLDPNLVKAMVYVESRMGYALKKDDHDVMQVADSRNAAIYALRNSFNPNVNKVATEYELINGKVTPLEYPEAGASTPAESIRWGVRWLYHVSQVIIQEDGKNFRKWFSWKEGIKKYNRGGDKQYAEKVYKIYEQGIDSRGFKLWSLAFLAILTAAMAWSILQSAPASNPKAKVLGASARNAAISPLDSEVSEIVLGCESVSGDISEALVLTNSVYKINSYPEFPKDKREIQLTKGGYGYQGPPPDKYESYDPEKHGPHSVICEKIERGDLDGDGLEDAAVVLRINNNGVGYYRELFVMRKNGRGEFKQVDSLWLSDRERFLDVKIHNGVIYAELLLRRTEDAQCCPTLKLVKKFKLFRSKVIEV